MSADPEPWRYRCPRGHTSWAGPEGGRYYCQSCEAGFDELVDAKTTATPTEEATPIADDPALEGVDDQTRRAVVALFDIDQTHLGGQSVQQNINN